MVSELSKTCLPTTDKKTTSTPTKITEHLQIQTFVVFFCSTTPVSIPALQSQTSGDTFKLNQPTQSLTLHSGAPRRSFKLWNKTDVLH